MPTALATPLLGHRERIIDRLVEIIGGQLGAALDAGWSRDADGVCSDGIVLPDLGGDGYTAADAVYRHPSPTVEDKRRLAASKQESVAAFVGVIGDKDNTDYYSATATEDYYKALVPMGAAICFGEISQDAPDAPAPQSRKLSPVEVMHARGIRYLEALEWVISAYGCFHAAIQDTIPRSDLPVTARVDIGEGQRTLIGVVYYEFDVECFVKFPANQTLP